MPKQKETMNIKTQKIINVREDWATTVGAYKFMDDGRQVQVWILPSPATPANARVSPPVLAVQATDAFFFVLWDEDAYLVANALNSGQGYGNSDLISAITAYLKNLAA